MVEADTLKFYFTPILATLKSKLSCPSNYHKTLPVAKMPSLEACHMKGNRTIADLRYGGKDIIILSTLIFAPIKR